ncbi:MAG: hypothetical protein ACKVQC_04980 [Elusimicrobiota bacterium]
MNFLNRLERKLGWLSIERLPMYVVTAQALIYIWGKMNPDNLHWLALDPQAIIYGHEYWRLITFLFITPLQNPLFAFFFLYLLFVYGEALEQAWGSFRLTLFFLIGAIGTMIGGLFFQSYDGAFYLNTSIFLAFAAVHPDFQVYLFFVIPVKVKWLAWVTWAYFIYVLFLLPISAKMGLIVSLANYLLFFGKHHVEYTAQLIAQYRRRQRFKNSLD